MNPPQETASLLLIRHGQSLWNAENRFTGWRDIGLTERGREEAREAAALLTHHQISFARAFTSALSRAQETCSIVLDAMGEAVPVESDPALNERDYGDLTGMNKSDIAERYGEAQLHRWRRSFAEKPPHGESLEETARRVIPYYESRILPCLKKGENIFISAHGNSLRALLMHLEKLSPEAIAKREVATGEALLYRITSEGAVKSWERLAK